MSVPIKQNEVINMSNKISKSINNFIEKRSNELSKSDILKYDASPKKLDAAKEISDKYFKDFRRAPTFKEMEQELAKKGFQKSTAKELGKQPAWDKLPKAEQKKRLEEDKKVMSSDKDNWYVKKTLHPPTRMITRNSGNPKKYLPDPEDDDRYEYGNGGEIQLKPENRIDEAESKIEKDFVNPTIGNKRYSELNRMQHKDLLGKFGQYYRVHSATEKTPKGDLIAGILEAEGHIKKSDAELRHLARLGGTDKPCSLQSKHVSAWPAFDRKLCPECKKTYIRKSIDPEELEMGIKVEMEHKDIVNGDPKIAQKIAIDHLHERPDYYSRLKEMESQPVQKAKNPYKAPKGMVSREELQESGFSGNMNENVPIDEVEAEIARLEGKPYTYTKKNIEFGKPMTQSQTKRGMDKINNDALQSEAKRVYGDKKPVKFGELSDRLNKFIKKQEEHTHCDRCGEKLGDEERAEIVDNNNKHMIIHQTCFRNTDKIA